ncbi:NUMOD4 domain-containing protein [Roseomonas xinghualingensis]|uniref:NUMOD4 domain-containing protein n=1 Tax=Roseomonas xinghualingensis TaxID=2986475 RepID=UPI00366AF206
MTTERWATVAGFEGRYEVSDFGRVRSVERLVRTMKRDGTWGERRIRSQILRVHHWGARYPGVSLLCADGSRTRRMVHQLVAVAFVPNPGGHGIINHLDADRSNSAATNLEWCDQARNMRHAYEIGRLPVGRHHHFAQLPRDARGRCMPRRNPGAVIGASHGP